jgi:FKBP-type peptidyl-prolyl cis-trans isomerase SlpA
MTTNYEIAENTRVTLHFSLALADGSMIDSTQTRAPANFTVGDGALLPGFEKALFGLQAGARRSYILPPEQAFGEYNEANKHSMLRSAFANSLDLNPGLVVSFADASKAEIPGVIIEVNERNVVVDFNHPLAGREIIFDVEIIAVIPADAAPVTLKQV